MPASPPASCGRGPGSVAFPGQRLASVNQHFPVRGWHRATTTVPPPGIGNVPHTPQGRPGQRLAPGTYGTLKPLPWLIPHSHSMLLASPFPVHRNSSESPKTPQNSAPSLPPRAWCVPIAPLHQNTLDLTSPPRPQAAMLRLGRGRSRGAFPQPPNSLLPARCRARAGSRWSLSAQPRGTAWGTWAWKGTAQLLRQRCPALARAPQPHSHPPGEFGLPQGHMPAVLGLSHVTQAGDTHTC